MYLFYIDIYKYFHRFVMASQISGTPIAGAYLQSTSQFMSDQFAVSMNLLVIFIINY